MVCSHAITIIKPKQRREFAQGKANYATPVTSSGKPISVEILLMCHGRPDVVESEMEGKIIAAICGQ